MAAGGELTVLEKLEDLNKLISIKVKSTNEFINRLLIKINENNVQISTNEQQIEQIKNMKEHIATQIVNIETLTGNIDRLTNDNAKMMELIEESTNKLEELTWRDVEGQGESTVGGKSKKLRKYSKIHTINKRKTTRKNKKHQTGGYKADYKINNSKWLNKKLYPRSSRVSRPRVSRPRGSRSRGSPNKHK